MTVTVKHSKTNAISDWTQAQLDEQIALGNFAEGTVLADIVLPSDWNNDHTLTGVGTMAEQDANSVAITGGTATLSSVTTPSVTATTDNLTLSAISTGVVNLNTALGNQVQVSNIGDGTRPLQLNGGLSGTNSGITSFGGMSLSAGSGGGNAISFYSNGRNTTQQFNISHTASAVNYVQVTGSATTARPVISTQGSDSNIGLDINAKGTSDVTFRSGTSATFQAIMNSGGDSWLAANRMTGLANLTATSASASNVAISLQTKGTGAIDLAAGSSGVNISNGGTVTAITRTGPGTGYTTRPTVAITAPTTAGGVQATATANLVLASVTSIGSGGTGYTAGDVLTISGGTVATQTAQVTVSTVSAGVITAVTVTRGGDYTVAPSNPASVTGGTGTGATFNLTFGILTPVITAAGSGYIEQPTVTFSGGGGSGAAAYATVGSIPTVRTLGSALSFNVPSGEVLRLSDGASAACYLNLQSSSTTIQTFASGAGANIGYQWVTKGVSNHSFATNNSVANEQFRVSHTASAVNYVQVTGGATGANPSITVQGSDATRSLNIGSKGTTFVILSNNGTVPHFSAGGSGSAVNYLNARGNVAGTSPQLEAVGTDTNIDLALTPKGTGLVRFGTYVAGALLATGYINIKAADGTTYKVLVST